MVTEGQIFLEIRKRRAKDTDFARAQGQPADNSDFEHLGERSDERASDAVLALGLMKTRGLLVYEAGGPRTVTGITLTEEGERRLAASLVATGETLD